MLLTQADLGGTGALVPGRRNKACHHLFVGGGSPLPFVNHVASVMVCDETRSACTDALTSLSGREVAGAGGTGRTGPAPWLERVSRPLSASAQGGGPGSGARRGSWSDSACTITVSPETSHKCLMSHTVQLPNCGKAAHRRHLWRPRKRPMGSPVCSVVGRPSGHTTPGPTWCPKGSRLWEKPSPTADDTCTRTLTCTQPHSAPDSHTPHTPLYLGEA